MWPLAVITFLEGLRHRVLYGIFLFALLAMFLSIIFSNFFMQDIGKVAVDFNLAAVSLAGLLISISLCINLIAKDLDKKTIYFVLSRSISRTEYIFGKYLGITLITLFAYLILTLLSGAALSFLRVQYIDYFDSFKWFAYLQGVYFDFLKICLFNALIIFFSTLSSSSFLTMLFSICIYIAGQSISEVINYLSLSRHAKEMSLAVQKAVHIFKYILPNLSLFDLKVLSAHGKLISAGQFLLFTGYAVVYSLILLILASLIFRQKEFL